MKAICEIQFIKRLNKEITTEDFNNFKVLMGLGSQQNNCAWGMFNEEISFKKVGGFDYKEKRLKNFVNSRFLVGHNRFATRGDKQKIFNNHPFYLGDFTLVHNGIISNYADLKEKFKLDNKVETDSFIIIYLINHFFKKGKNRVESIKKAIEETAELLQGSFSVFLFDKISKNLFYFKNNKTEFMFGLTEDNLLIGTTDSRNLDYLFVEDKWIFEKRTKKILRQKAKDKTIYLINDDVFIKAIGSFKECATSPCSWGKGWGDDDDLRGCWGGGLDIGADLAYLTGQKIIFEERNGDIVVKRTQNDENGWECLQQLFPQKEDNGIMKIKLDDICDYF